MPSIRPDQARNGRGKSRLLLAGLLDPAGTASGIDSLDSACPDWTETVRFAGHHLITPALWPALVAHGLADSLDADLSGYLAALHALNARRNKLLIAQAAEITATLGSAGTEPVFLKGAAMLLDGLHSDPGARFCGDIDLLVAPEHLEASTAALLRAGYRLVADPSARVHDPVKLVRTGCCGLVELHVSPLSFCFEHVMPAATVTDRARRVAGPNGAEPRIPCPTDMVVHVVAHAMLQHRGWRLAELPLRDALDLAALAWRHGATIDWAEVAERLSAAPWGAGIAAFPASVVAELFTSTWLPAPAPGPRARLALLRWRLRGDRPPGRLAHAAARLLDFGNELAWRLGNVPEERRRITGLAMDPRHWLNHLRLIHNVARGGLVVAFPGRRRGRIPSTVGNRT